MRRNWRIPRGWASWWRGLLLPVLAFGMHAAVAFGDGVRVPGVTRPVRDEILSALVSGRIEAVHVEEGERVEAGDVLIGLYRRMEELEVSRRKLIWESTAEVESAEARVSTTKTDYESTKRVHETTQSFSADEVSRKELEYKLALAELKRLRIQEEREKIEYELAREQLLLREIRAPFAGWVTSLPLQAGENCQPHQPLVRLVDGLECHFVANIEAALVHGLSPGQVVVLEIQRGSSSVRVEGTISFISPVVDAASGLREVKVFFRNPDGMISPGVAGVMVLPAGSGPREE